MLSFDLRAYKRYGGALVVLLGALFLFCALASFSLRDPSLFFGSAGTCADEVANVAGLAGAHSASLFIYLFGYAAWLLVPALVLASLVCAGAVERRRMRQLLAGGLLLLMGLSAYSHLVGIDLYTGVCAGGVVGRSVAGLLGCLFDGPVVSAALFLINSIGVVLIVQYAWVRPCIAMAHRVYVQTGAARMVSVVREACLVPFKKGAQLFTRTTSAPVDRLAQMVHAIVAEESGGSNDTIFDDPFWQTYQNPQNAPVVASVSVSKLAADVSPVTMTTQFAPPPVTLFRAPEAVHDRAQQEVVAQERAKNLQAKLELFGITGTVIAITVGPVVTLFEYIPASDVKVSKIVTLEDDLTLALEAHSLRIIAPIPGRSVVGFEVANVKRQTVHFSDIVTAPPFRKSKAALPLIIGRDTTGADLVIDLIEAPHLLVAGSTGSGKSVALNAMLTSILCKAHPDEVRLVLIDPKRLEFAPFADVAHLVVPIVTEVARAALVLRWAVKTMEERYEQLAAAGVRSVGDFHKKYGAAAMPYMVIIIDELADLMMTAGREVEELIARLAQMARAAGIHLIVATQRPSVDVITGLIKVNFPSRIACKVISKVDSRTILDFSGAEKLLGKGDMLYLNQKGVVMRAHGAYVKDEEVAAVVAHVKQQRAVVYEDLSVAPQADENVYDEDPLYNDVCTYVCSQEQVSISLLQRKFRIGYNRSARLIDTLEARGVVMPADGSKFRKVLRS